MVFILSIIIPAYNEEKRIEKTLQEYLAYFPTSEIIVVLNGCTDRTMDIIKRYPVRYINIKESIGKGKAIIEGFKIATGDFISFIDADNSVSARYLENLLNHINGFDGIIGSRWIDGGLYLGQSKIRLIASKIYNLLTRIILGLKYHDTQCPCKIFRREIILEVLPKLHGFNYAFDTELLYMLKNKNILEYPVIFEHKKGSKIRLFRDARKMFYTLLWLRLKNVRKM